MGKARSKQAVKFQLALKGRHLFAKDDAAPSGLVRTLAVPT